jgi:desulfoferrodoxin (superoxide reductase-like protein)
MLTRRALMTGLGAVLLVRRAGAGQGPSQEHLPWLDLPLLTEDPAAVPVIVGIDHPMEPDHYIRSIQITLATDPVPDKGLYRFTPLSGRAWVSFQMRSGVGGEVQAEVDDTRHGKFVASGQVRVAEGGCGVGPDKVNKERSGNPITRLPRSYRAGQIIEVRAKIDHGSHTGLAFKAGTYVREAPPYYLSRLLATVDGAPVCDFRLTSAVSPNPLIRFTLKVPGPGTLRVVWTNNEGRSWVSTQPLRPA